MPRKPKPYSPTRDYIFKDIPKPEAKMIESFLEIKALHEKKTITEVFTEVMMQKAIDYFGKDDVDCSMDSYRDGERIYEKWHGKKTSQHLEPKI